MKDVSGLRLAQMRLYALNNVDVDSRRCGPQRKEEALLPRAKTMMSTLAPHPAFGETACPQRVEQRSAT